MLKRLQKMTCSVDVTLVDERELWPTWFCVPALSTHVDHVVATFWAFSHGASYKNLRTGFLSVYDREPEPIVWYFYALMEWFLKCGPVGKQRRREGCSQEDLGGMTVQVLTLDFVTPPDPKTLPAPEMTYHDWLDLGEIPGEMSQARHLRGCYTSRVAGRLHHQGD